MLTLDAAGAVLELEDGRYFIPRAENETDAQLMARAGDLVALTPKQRRGLMLRQARAAQRLADGTPRKGDEQRASLPSSTPRKAETDADRLAAALEASGIAARLFSVDTEDEDA